MRRLNLTLVALLFLHPQAVWAAPSATETIEDFYQSYLTTDTDRMKRRPPFSRGFLHDEAEDRAVCEQSAGADICGWDAEFNPYLNAQDFADDLTYNNADVDVTQPKPNVVQVRLNIFPEREGTDSIRNITYLMTREQDNWVVDNIIIDNGEAKPFMARRVMLDEIAKYRSAKAKPE